MLKNAAATFFISGTGGLDVYKEKDLLAAHKGMNISGTEFMAVLDDALNAMKEIMSANENKRRFYTCSIACVGK